ncbi:Structural maintenance of chromosomes protein 3 [Toxocara canis]|uniref:Structural maintenance of chromosomes protein 3 n=1 Tax=Toxocara canis TaxID=6265 RepID=A0A0B2VAE8_TOXCA|nr:Structural maintenance of chromosomes protein 3 [Toxocara canis]
MDFDEVIVGRREEAEETLKKVNIDITTKQEELDVIVLKYDALVNKEAELGTDIRILDQRCEELYSKQGQKDQYRTVEERDSHLKKRIHFYERQIAETNDRMAVGKEMEECAGELTSLNFKMTDLRNQLYIAVSHQQEAARDQKAAYENMQAIRDEVSQADQDLRRISGKSIMNGVDSLRRVMQHFRDHNSDGRHDPVLNGYHGMLINLFEFDNEFLRTVEVTAGNRLFYHVVDNERIAMQILNEMNARSMMGEVYFFPISRLIAKPIKAIADPDGRPLIESIRYQEKFDVVFREVFGGTAIVRDMEAGVRIMRTEQVDCVTSEGDQVRRRGAVTGGYFDIKRSRLELHRTLVGLLQRQNSIEEALKEASHQNSEKAANVEKLKMEETASVQKAALLREKHDGASRKRCDMIQQMQQIVKSKEPKVALCVTERNRVREMQANMEDLQRELGTALHSQLSTDEQTLLRKLQTEVKEKKTHLEEVVGERAKLSSQKFRVENLLSTNLLRKRETLQAKVDDISLLEKNNKLQTQMVELKSLNNRISEIVERLTELDESLLEYVESREELLKELELQQEQRKEHELEMAEFSKQYDFICSKLLAMEAKREDNQRKMRELRLLPVDANGYEGCSSKELGINLNNALEHLKTVGDMRELRLLPVDANGYEGCSSKELGINLNNALEHLKTVGDVNQAACEQYAEANDLWGQLMKRFDENNVDRKSVEEMLAVLEQRKYDAIQLTFKLIAKNFRSVFRKLVPDGDGKLIMRLSAVRAGDEHGDQRNTVEAFTGVGIKVSFGGGKEMCEVRQLSGGQKSVVALALIFAIQMVDAAPFYLLDEVDAALDTQYRKAIADTIHELSEKAQFITTTFRPELLVGADKYFGVTFRNKESHIDVVTKEQAYNFIESAHTDR